jgi:RimJ/RimL family protein N-acetyltransferase
MGEPMTSEVRLRDVVAEDLPVFFEQQLDPEAVRMAAFPSRDRAAFVAHWADNVLGDETVVKKAIVFDGEVAGYVVCFEQSGRPLVGYWIGKRYWGRGDATRALSEFLRGVGTRPLYAYVAKHNAGSIRVLEKSGFRICGGGRASDADVGEIEELTFRLDGSDVS